MKKNINNETDGMIIFTLQNGAEIKIRKPYIGFVANAISRATGIHCVDRYKKEFRDVTTISSASSMRIDTDGDDEILGFYSTKIMMEPCNSIGMISNKIEDILKASKYIPFSRNNIVSSMDINDTRILSKDYNCDEDNF